MRRCTYFIIYSPLNFSQPVLRLFDCNLEHQSSVLGIQGLPVNLTRHCVRPKPCERRLPRTKVETTHIFRRPPQEESRVSQLSRRRQEGITTSQLNCSRQHSLDGITFTPPELLAEVSSPYSAGLDSMVPFGVAGSTNPEFTTDDRFIVPQVRIFNANYVLAVLSASLR